MIDSYINNPKSIKYHVKKFLQEKNAYLKGKVVIDLPSGNGATSEILHNMGAKVEAFDLFPEYFMLKNIDCKRADVNDKIDLPNEYANMLICQEGIEHFSDQLKVLKEFNRVLKKNGELVITTPSYSNLLARFSYFLFESEGPKLMPPNEIDDIWMADKEISNEIYHGHIFLIGLQKLRVLGKLSGFDIDQIRYVRLSKGSLGLFILFYPFILLRSLLSYSYNMKKEKNFNNAQKKAVYKEQLKININVKNLLSRHTFVVFKKVKNYSDVDFQTEKAVKEFDKIM